MKALAEVEGELKEDSFGAKDEDWHIYLAMVQFTLISKNTPARGR
jgi:hypothetical protein